MPDCSFYGKDIAMSIFNMTSGSIYLPTALPAMRTSTVKPAYLLEQDPDNPYYTDALDKYFARPNVEGPRSCTYFEYFSKYLISKTRQGNRQGWQDSNGYYVYPRAKVITYITFSRIEPFATYLRILTNEAYRQSLSEAITAAFVMTRLSSLSNS